MLQYKMKRTKSLGWIQHCKDKVLSSVIRSAGNQSALPNTSDNGNPSVMTSDDTVGVLVVENGSDEHNNVNNGGHSNSAFNSDIASVTSSSISIVHNQHQHHQGISPGSGLSKSMPSSPCASSSAASSHYNMSNSNNNDSASSSAMIHRNVALLSSTNRFQQNRRDMMPMHRGHHQDNNHR